MRESVKVLSETYKPGIWKPGRRHRRWKLDRSETPQAARCVVQQRNRPHGLFACHCYALPIIFRLLRFSIISNNINGKLPFA